MHRCGQSPGKNGAKPHFQAIRAPVARISDGTKYTPQKRK
jgi:hypothetical protein